MHGKFLIVLLAFPITLFSQIHKNVDHINIQGYIGNRIDECIQKRVKAQDALYLVAPFKEKKDESSWQTEFWGKWVQGAIASYRYKKDEALYAKIKSSVDEIIKTKGKDGYIGNYNDNARLTNWDVWGRKYSTLGLLAWYDLTKDNNALSAAKDEIDCLIEDLKTRNKSIVNTGNFHGMASSSILEPVVYLYNYTHEKRYLDFANYIVAQWETTYGPQLISKAIQGIPVALRFPHPDNWFSPANGQKAYEMMSCYIGLLELYKITNNTSFLSAVVKSADDIANNEINIAGSGSSFECWYNGAAKQTLPSYHTMETCVTFTWMQLCNKLLELTGNPFYADQFEKSMYNALMASFKDDGSQIAKYSPLQGRRSEGEHQCGMIINCCNANGPRAFAMIPDYAFKLNDNIIDINYYGVCDVELNVKGKKMHISQTGEYPKSDNVHIAVNPEAKLLATLKLRIPLWSRTTEITLNGKKLNGVLPGSYYTITKKWDKGDAVDIKFDMPVKVTYLNHMQAFTKGPLLLARDSRFNDGFVDESALVNSQKNIVESKENSYSFAWVCYKIPLVLGTNLESDEKYKTISFCDFASAGNCWRGDVRYRVWIPETLDVRKTE